MARGFRIHARLACICGCFFIRDLFSTRGAAGPRVVWKSWYSLYSCACLAFLLWIEQDVFDALVRQLAEPEERFKSCLRLFIQDILFLRIILNFSCTLLSSSRLVAFYKRASDFEKEIGMLPCECCAPRRFFWSDIQRGGLCVLYCLVLTIFDTHYDPAQWPSAMGHSPLMQAYSWTKIFLTQFAYFTYDNICAASLRSSCQVLSEYLGKLLSLLTDCIDSQPVVSTLHVDKATRVEEIRLHLSTVRLLKEEINDIWR